MASVSVIIPVYNRAKRVRRAIQSVLCQTYSDLEVVVVDDGSNDDTMQIVQEEARRDSRVRPIRRDQRKGAQAARNAGIRAARGEWIAFLDSDDYWMPDSLEARLNLVGIDRTQIVHSDGYLLKAENTAMEYWHLPNLHGNIYKQLLRLQGPMFQSLLAAKEAFVRIDYLDESIISYQEWETSIRLSKHYRFVFLPRPTFVYDCTNSDSISKSGIREALGYEQVFTKHVRPIFRKWGPRILAGHYRRAANFYKNAGDSWNSRRCRGAALCLWPFSLGTLADIFGDMAGHPLSQKLWNQVRHTAPGRALKWLRGRLTRETMQKHSCNSPNGEIDKS